MAVFTLGYNIVVGFQPQYTFIGASDPNGFDPRSGTMWSLLGPAVTFQSGGGLITVNETYWFAFGTGLDVNPLAALPTTGTITDLFHVIPLEGAPPPAAPQDTFVDYVFTTITGLDIAAADFAAAAVAGTVADLLLAGDDLFKGSSTLSDFMLAPVHTRTGAGDDTVFASGSNDNVMGESGDDLIVLPDQGIITSQRPGSLLDGGTGDDTLIGGAYNDMLFGGADSDRLSGGRGDDTLFGDTGRDRLLGGDGKDLVIVTANGLIAGEVINGGAGNDTLALFDDSGVAPDITGCLVTGFETLQLNSNLRLTIGQLTGVQGLQFGGFITVTLADSGFVDLSASGVWQVSNFLSQLTVQAGAGRDIINGRDTADVGTAAPGSIAYGAGDLINAGGGQDVVNGGSGADFVRGEGGNDTLSGEAGQDTLMGEVGADSLAGGGGNDRLIGGTGADVMAGGDGADVFVFAAYADSTRSGSDLVQDFVRGQDLIDLSGVVAGDLLFNGQVGFVGGGLASVYYDMSGPDTVIRVDDGSGGTPEMVIRLTGVVELAPGDLLL